MNLKYKTNKLGSTTINQARKVNYEQFSDMSVILIKFNEIYQAVSEITYRCYKHFYTKYSLCSIADIFCLDPRTKDPFYFPAPVNVKSEVLKLSPFACYLMKY